MKRIIKWRHLLLDEFTKIMIQDVERQTAEDVEQEKRRNFNYKPTSLRKLILWPLGIVAVIALLFVFMAR